MNLSKEPFPQSRHQRGPWHLQTTTGYYLWKNGLAKEGREPFTRRLKRILKEKTATKQRAENQLQSFVQRPQAFGCQRTVAFLSSALPDVLTYEDEPVPAPPLNWYDGSQSARVSTTGVLEREMSDINPRADGGV